MQCRPFRRRANLALAVVICTAVYFLLPQLATTEPTVWRVVISTPGNATDPFHSLSLPTWHLTPLSISSPTDLFPTHIEKHPLAEDVYIVTNEVETGSILAVKLTDASEVVAAVSSGGNLPAYCAVQNENAICSNYGSPTISLHRLVPGVPYIRHLSDLTLPTTTSHSAESHPHQVIVHPSIPGLVYVPDLGLNTIFTLRIDHDELRLLGQLLIPEDIGKGPRHGVMTLDGKHLILGFQTSNTAAVLPVDSDGTIIAPMSSLSTLPIPTASKHALSDIHVSPEGTVYVLNRQIAEPYQGEGDTVALFRLADGRLESEGWIQLPCWQPREILPLGGEVFAISCIGANGVGGGVVVIQDRAVVEHWEGQSSWGLSIM